MEVIARLVAQGQGVALLPCDYYKAEVSLGKLEILQVEPVMPNVDFTLLSFAQRPTAFVSAVTEAVEAVRRQRPGAA
jgi:DNA-binding transcriptional LysR family regulator